MNPLLALLAATSSVATSGTAELVAPSARFALVIGVNQPLPGSDYETLRYADDDAMRFAELFESAGMRTIVLAAPDRETADRHPRIADRAERPTRERFDAALERLAAEMDALEGVERELYFFFSGHGSISSTLAYLHLFDGKLTRTDLYARLLERVPAERIHVIIDSCHSYFLVNARGRRVAVAEDEEDLDRYPSAGFLLSTSGNREVQEWSGYEAGVFSHQLLGAMRGAADVDRDGVVTYDEAHAYVVAANLGVEREDARIRPYVRRPTTRGRALIDLRMTRVAARTVIPRELSGHFFISDDSGTRILDANKPRGIELALFLPDRPLYLRANGALYAISGGAVRRADAPAEDLLASSKGTIADELRTNLFKLPLTEDFVRGLSAGTPQITHVHRAPHDAWHRDPLTLGLLGGGVAGTAAGVIGAVLFAGARADAERMPITAETESARARASDLRLVMGVSFAAGGALLTAGILRAILEDGGDTLAISAGPGGAGVMGRF